MFGEGTPEHIAFYNAQEQVCPGASALLPIMINAWQPWAKEHCYTLSDGFEAYVKVTAKAETKIEIDELDHATFKYRYEVNQGTEQGVALAANIIQAIDGMIVREMNRRCNHDKGKLRVVRKLLCKRLSHRHLNGVVLDSIQEIWKDHGFTSLVDVENLDWDDIKTFDFTYCECLIPLIDRTLNRPSFPVIMVHDEFMTHPNYVNWVRLTYIEIMAEISDSEILPCILKEITGKKVNVPRFSDSISAEILQSEYPLS